MGSKQALAYLGAAAALGALSGWVAWSTSEVLPAVIAVFVCSSALGAWKPKWFLVGGLIVGCAVPAFYVFSDLAGFPSKFPPEPNVWASAVAIVPALAGAAIGAAIGSTTARSGTII